MTSLPMDEPDIRQIVKETDEAILEQKTYPVVNGITVVEKPRNCAHMLVLEI